MRDALPAGWRRVRLGDVADTALGKMLDRGKVRGGKQVPYLRNQNVQWGRIELDDVSEMELLDEELDRFEVRAGDLLVCEGGEIGRCAIWPGGETYIAYQKALHRVRPGPDLDARFLRYVLEDMAERGELARRATGSTIKHLPQVALRELPLAIPPLDEQQRVVDVLEANLSRLTAASRLLRQVKRRSDGLRDARVESALLPKSAPASAATKRAVVEDVGILPALPRSWTWARLGDLAQVVGGITMDASKQRGQDDAEVPYLRVANVQRARLDLTTLKTIRAPASKVEQLRLRDGDVLMNEGGDRDKLGRGWVWTTGPDPCIHQNHVYRARTDGRLLPELLSWWTNTVGGQWCERHGRQSVNLASISLSRIKQMPVPLPPAAEQQEMSMGIEEAVSAHERLSQDLADASRHGDALRRTLLATAFEGAL